MLFVIRMILMTLHFLVVGVTGLVIVLSRPFNPDNSRVLGRMYSLPAIRILGLRVRRETDGALNHPRTYVIVANHQSNYDLFVLGCTVPVRTVTIGKKSLKWLPFFGQIYWLSGNVLIDRGNAFKAKQAMLTTTDTLQHQDTNIWVFAEGTRNLGLGLKPLKKGAFQMAISAGVPIIPICTSTYKKSMRLNRWHSGDVIIRSLSPIPTAGLTMDDMPDLMAKVHADMKACIEQLDDEVSRSAR
ncbi:MAG: 1-acylglycerol-3-phosphate O-acyltransferase [Burkholderiales bacterium]|nr:1-acylglycerol-3-phosphate O-acyltransferase [Burkholderiales bacterium]MDE2432076.1 1-acylglycerol-3-phosphate O-acyltransferase [Burkholderiales bacterium]HET8694466.1 1-acylglycerol-3-phosphate O-acyltransferase [Aquabacterium sp.]